MSDHNHNYWFGCNRCIGQGKEYGWNGALRTPIQQRIWHTVGVQSSAYASRIATAAIKGGPGNRPVAAPGVSNLNWRQSSDRARPHIQSSVVPSKGNSLRGTLTSLRPGASAPGGSGVDIKHNSYARYLAKKRSRNIGTSPGVTPPGFSLSLNNQILTDFKITKGYKIGTFGIGVGSRCCS